jgi:hypothetical protein
MRANTFTVVMLCMSGVLLITGATTMVGDGDDMRRQYALIAWLLGALTTLDLVLLSRGGRPWHPLLLASAVAGTYLSLYDKVLDHVTDGVGRIVLIVLTAGIALMAWTRMRPPSPAETLQEMAAEARYRALPERPEDPAAEIARIQGIIAGHIEYFLGERPVEARAMLDLLERYRTDHGTNTVSTSSRPLALKNAAKVLVEDFERIHEELTERTGCPYAVLALSYARRMSDLVADRTR